MTIICVMLYTAKSCMQNVLVIQVQLSRLFVNLFLGNNSDSAIDVNSVDLPPSAFKNTAGLDAGILFGFYSTSTLFPLRLNKTLDNSSAYKTIGSAIIAAKIAGQMVKNLVQPASIKLTITAQVRLLDELPLAII